MVNTKLAAACGAGVLLLGAAACGSSDDPADAGGQPQTSTDGGPSSTGNGGQFPGADGKVAAVDGSTAQVQSRADGQVAVTWNASTTFTKQVAASLDYIKAGTCVMVQPADADSGSSSDTTEVTAGTVRITEKVDGSCTGGLRAGPAGGGDRPEFNGQAPDGGEPPEGFEPPADGGGNGGPQVRALGGAFGEVTAVSADGFTVKATVPRFGDSGSAPTTEETSVAVTVTGSTTYTTTGEGSAADVKVGACMRAEGDTDSTGAVTAKTIALTPATAEGECGGMVLRGGPPPGGADSSGTGPAESTES